MIETEGQQPQETSLAVRHRTVFEYGGEVWNSVNTLHLEPRPFRMQNTLGSLVEVLPSTKLRRYRDLFGNIAHQFEVEFDHRRLEIESSVKVRNRPLLIADEAKAAGLEFLNRTGTDGTVWQYLQDSRWVVSKPEIWRQAVDLTQGRESVYGMATVLMEWIHSEFRYATGVTDVNTHLDEVFELRTGVCQDFTHVMIGLCRSLGIPARYASGYLYNGPRDNLIGARASHAWCEVFLPGEGWIGFDPTNNNLADERYVKIAVGRDYEDVAPVRGSYRGTARCRMEVRVTVEKN